MSNDDSTFIREVNEDLRSDFMKALWKRYRFLVFSVAAVIVIGTAGWRGYEYWRETEAAKSGDAFLAALELARDGKRDEAESALQALEKDGFGSYPVLAAMRAASLQAEKGDFAAAISAFQVIGNTNSNPAAIRDTARLRAAYLLIDHGSYDDVRAIAEVLATPSSPSRHSAREALGFAAWKAENYEAAAQWFGDMAADQQTPASLAARANVMLDLLAARGLKASG